MGMTCAWKECDNQFVPNTHNQKYCSPECCKLATNAKIMERYYETRARRRGAKRKCNSCGAGLSRYNPGKVCAACEAAIEDAENKDLLNTILLMSR